METALKVGIQWHETKYNVINFDIMKDVYVFVVACI